MSSTFFGLEIARRALAAQQAALNVTGHNISNSNTQGYTRQIANLTATTPDSILSSGRNLSVGSGVTLDTITRARDVFVDRQFRSETSKQQYWSTKQDNLTQVEEVLNEPSDDSLSNDLNKFWTAWSDLSKDPDNVGARSVVSERAQTLTDSFHNIAQQVSDIKNNTDLSIKVQINQINIYGQQIRDLNAQIKRAEVAGDNPNDLKDKRDSLVDDLSKIVNVKVVESKDPTFTDRDVSNYKVIIGNENSTSNSVLVDDATFNSLNATPTIDSNGISTIAWSNGEPLDLGTKLGTLSADLETRNTDIPNFVAQIDALAQGMANAVNVLHRTGQGLTAETQTDASGKPIGIDFFTDGTDSTSTLSDLPVVTAATITLNSTIENNVNRIATGTIPSDGTATVTVGDGTVAQAISSLSSGWDALKSVIADGSFVNTIAASSLSDMYAANVAQLGAEVQQAKRMKAGEDVLVTNATNSRQSLSGVSLDEEMTNLVQYQKSYSAAARVVTMMDDMLSTLLNMGVTK